MNATQRRLSSKVCVRKRAAILILCALISASIPAADKLPNDFYERIHKSYVEILVEGHLDGSGWIAEPEGFAVTASHVVNTPGKHVEVLSPTYGRLDATVVAIDRGNDVAVLKLPTRDEGYSALPFAAKAPPAGSNVYLLGSPVYRHSVLHTATVARDVDTFEFMPFSSDYVRVMHLSGFGAPGSSGGPWVNAKGEIVGLNSGLMRDGQSSAGIGFMVSGEPIRNLVRSKKTPGTPTLGSAFEEIWEQKADYIKKFPPKTEGLALRVLKKDGPAMRAGLAEGDLVVAIDDKPVRLRDEAVNILRGRKSGDVVKMKLLLPAGGTTEKTVPLGDLEADWAVAKPQP